MNGGWHAYRFFFFSRETVKLLLLLLTLFTRQGSGCPYSALIHSSFSFGYKRTAKPS
jgi:hypothetical protein